MKGETKVVVKVGAFVQTLKNLSWEVSFSVSRAPAGSCDGTMFNGWSWSAFALSAGGIVLLSLLPKREVDAFCRCGADPLNNGD